MMHPSELRIEDFTYALPDDKIASYPLERRDESKLLVYRYGEMVDDHYYNLAEHLPPSSTLVFNNTRVVEARLIFQKPTGGQIEIFCLEPGELNADITMAMGKTSGVVWKCLVGGASKWKHGTKLQKHLSEKDSLLTASIVDRTADSFFIKFEWKPDDLSFADILHLAGQIPLPPYLNRPVEDEDKLRYQTIYARHEGSVAAPTAGLHFTEHVFNQLKRKDIATDYVTLHVGAGTFKPVKSERIGEHNMHAEYMDVSIETITNIRDQLQNTIVAVGTTSVRTLESLYWMGVKIANNNNLELHELQVQQWESYEAVSLVTPAAALGHLLDWMKKNRYSRLLSKTSIIIAPGYTLQIVDALVTNFHQPQSTLLLLIAAFTGMAWKDIYDHALQNEYRFLSYGDGCLLWKQS